MNDDHASLLSNLRVVLDTMDTLIAAFPRRMDRDKAPVLAIFLTIYDLADAMVALFSMDILASIPTLLRSAIDSLYDLKLLHQDPENIGFLTAKALSETIKRLQAQLDPRNREGDSQLEPKKADLLRAELRSAKAQLADLKKRGYSPLRHVEKFKMLGQKHFHAIVFGILNKEAHNSIDILMGRHVEITSDTSVRFRYKERGDGARAIEIYRHVALTLVDAVCFVGKLAAVELRAELEAMIDAVFESFPEDTAATLKAANWYDYEE